MSIIKTNRWSCLLDSFAFASGIPAYELATWIGHDGTDCGFHTQELIEVLLDRGLAITEIQRYPVAIHPETLEQRTITFGGSGCERRFVRQLYGRKGVLMGVNYQLNPHAVAWKNNQIHDSATGESSILLRGNSPGYLPPTDSELQFFPKIFLRITNIS